MKHPIYRDADYNSEVIDIYRGIFSTAGLNHEEAVTDFCEFIASMPAAKKQGVRPETITAYGMKISLMLDIEADGLIVIDGHDYEWDSEVSRATIGKTSLASFKFPFNSGAINLPGHTVLFSVRQIPSPLKGVPPSQELNIVFPSDSGIIALFIGGAGSISDTLDSGSFSDKSIGIAYAVLSILLYVGSFSSDTELVSAGKNIKAKAGSKDGSPAHTIKFIKVKQIVKGDKPGGVKKLYDKAWVVRGHWRNQHYSKTDTYSPKWISPYWKGEGKELVDKVYDVERE
ncbi:MAG: hypothetical protein DRN17_05625 [Thermoplasmata archaeon]|nr:MAG: hypothetical protein DRN17_05625 [Thermoplasmata archaeon]